MEHLHHSCRELWSSLALTCLRHALCLFSQLKRELRYAEKLQQRSDLGGQPWGAKPPVSATGKAALVMKAACNPCCHSPQADLPKKQAGKIEIAHWWGFDLGLVRCERSRAQKEKDAM